MGIGFRVEDRNCNISWSYTSFNEFRKKLARTIGIDLEEMQGFRKKHQKDPEYVKIGWKSWDSVKSPLKNLLNQPDDNGILTSEQCSIIAPMKI